YASMILFRTCIIRRNESSAFSIASIVSWSVAVPPVASSLIAPSACCCSWFTCASESFSTVPNDPAPDAGAAGAPGAAGVGAPIGGTPIFVTSIVLLLAADAERRLGHPAGRVHDLHVRLVGARRRHEVDALGDGIHVRIGDVAVLVGVRVPRVVDHPERRLVLVDLLHADAFARALRAERRERRREVAVHRLRREDHVPPPVRAALGRPRRRRVREVRRDDVQAQALRAERAAADRERAGDVHQRVPSMAWRRSAMRFPRMCASARYAWPFALSLVIWRSRSTVLPSARRGPVGSSTTGGAAVRGAASPPSVPGALAAPSAASNAWRSAVPKSSSRARYPGVSTLATFDASTSWRCWWSVSAS